MKITYKEIEPEQFVKVAEIFGINLSIFKNYLMCFCAFSGNEIIGILLLTEEDECTIRIRFFHVLPLFRCNNIGSTLLKLAENYAISIHFKRMIVKYNNVETDMERCHHLFLKNYWTEGRYTHTKFCFKKENFEKNYISKFFDLENTRLHKEMIFLFFNELSEEKKNQIKEQSEKILSNGLLPFNNLELMIKDLSVFAFKENALIAWSVTDFVKQNEISIRNTFVINEFRNSGLGMYLWYLIFCRARENYDFDSIKRISFDFQKEDEKLNKLYTLLFGKILEQRIDFYISEKNLV